MHHFADACELMLKHCRLRNIKCSPLNIEIKTEENS
jgi:hypothetical protein